MKSLRQLWMRVCYTTFDLNTNSEINFWLKIAWSQSSLLLFPNLIRVKRDNEEIIYTLNGRTIFGEHVLRECYVLKNIQGEHVYMSVMY